MYKPELIKFILLGLAAIVSVTVLVAEQYATTCAHARHPLSSLTYTRKLSSVSLLLAGT